MTQPPVSGRGPGEQPGRDPGVPGGVPVPDGPAGERVLRLADFGPGGAGDTCPPGLALAEALDRVSGPDRRCGLASDDELIGVLARWGALESWVAAAKLGVIAELIRRRARPGHENRAGGGLPDSWDEGTGHEVAEALAQSISGADNLVELAWELQARLPGIAALAATINLTFPMGTYLGRAQRPGLGHGLGPLDPKLARDLAAAAARSPHSKWCVTVTDADGIAVGHGCARPARKRKRKGKAPPGGGRDGPPEGRPAFTPRDDPGPPGGYGTWTLTLPDGRDLDVALMPIPVTDCDHRYESHGYQPSDLLRHLVQIRDGQCTFPCCSRPARESDFEHAIPYDQGGRTCACNAGARSRRCHKVKQSKGWSVTQPRPGWHQWTTPSGRTYTQGPMKYPI